MVPSIETDFWEGKEFRGMMMHSKILGVRELWAGDVDFRVAHVEM